MGDLKLEKFVIEIKKKLIEYQQDDDTEMSCGW